MRIVAILLALATVSLAGPAWRDGPGPHEVAVVETVRLDGLEVRATFPKGEGKAPVLVFSHGMYGSKDGYEPLARFWASHGYVVLQPTHPDSLKNGLKPRQEATRAWDERPAQVSKVIDSFAAIEEKVPGLKGRLDPERIGMGGHSFGAHTSMLIGGAVAYPGLLAKGKSFRDPRVKCTLLISPQGVGGIFREDSWKDYAVPALVITGSRDESPLTGAKPETRLDPYRHGPAGKMHLVWIEEAHHGFGGISGSRWPGAGPRDDGQVWVVQQASLAFLDAFVKGDEAAKRWLEAGDLQKTDKAKVRCESRKTPPEPASPRSN